jgi:PAS domain S-box-containing protein
MATDYARFFQVSPEPLATLDASGRFVELNPAWTAALGLSTGELVNTACLDLVHPEDRESVAAALAGRGAELLEARARGRDGRYRWLRWTVATDGGAAYVCARDVTDERQARIELEQAEALASQYETESRRLEEELRSRGEAQSDVLQSMSTPIIQVWDEIVTMPVVGLVDSMRASDMKNSLLDTVARTGAKFAIVDLTGVDTVDTATADHLLRVMRAVGLLGARCVITGIQPAVAQIIVGLGLDMQGVITLRSLREGLKFCMRSLGFRVKRDPIVIPGSVAAGPGNG